MIKIVVTVCIGSGCHVKGSREIISKLKSYIARKELSTRVELEGCFCQNHCTEGVVVKFNDKIVKNITKDNIINVLKKELQGEE